ncbi:MAG: phytanoyl-CoA dioxygenase family protein [Terriglobia bacterium]
MKPHIFEGASVEQVMRDVGPLAEVYHECGALAFPGLLRDDPLFLAYLHDLEDLARTLLCEVRSTGVEDLDLADSITALAAADRPSVGRIFDLGTRPAKLMSGQSLKLHPLLTALTSAAFGPGALIASPSQSDTLHLFPPGQANWRYNSPLHQDYPYLLQSPRQITFWINFGRYIPEVGGVTYWPGSHKLGVRKQRKGEFGTLVAAVEESELSAHEQQDHFADVGDVLVMNSLVLHRSIKNQTTDGSRIVQLFRYSDLRHPQAVQLRWVSAEFQNGGAAFAAAHPDLVVAD